MSETIHIETSILGYLSARSTNKLILAANIKVTQDWWNNRCNSFVLYTSEIVEDEAARGDTEIATEEAAELAQEFLRQSNLLAKASNDALHMALATVYSIDYLLTGNCKHMANARLQKKLSQVSIDLGYELPIICTPDELMGLSFSGE